MLGNIPTQDVHVGERGDLGTIAGLKLGPKNRLDPHPSLAELGTVRVGSTTAQLSQQLVELRRLELQLLLEASNLSTSCRQSSVGRHQRPPSR